MRMREDGLAAVLGSLDLGSVVRRALVACPAAAQNLTKIDRAKTTPYRPAPAPAFEQV